MVIHSNIAERRSTMTKPREHNHELMKRRRSPSPTTTTNGRDPDLDHNKIISLHQDRTSPIIKEATNSRTKTSTEADLTKETIEMKTGTEIILSSRTTSTTSMAITITLQVVDQLLLVPICETIHPILEIGQIARITSVHDHKTQILSTTEISQPTITVSQTPYSSLTKKDRTVLVQSRSTL